MESEEPRNEEGLEFITFVRSQRLPVSMSVIQERARLSAASKGIAGLRVRNFLRRTGTQKSLRLHAKAGSVMPSDHAERMEELRSVASKRQGREESARSIS